MSNEIPIYLNELPMVASAGWYRVDSPWYHVDRNVPVNFLIFVLEGSFSVVEDGLPYEVPKNHLFFLKANKHQTGHKLIESGANWLWVSFEDIDPSGSDKEIMTLPKTMGFQDPHKFQLMISSLYHTQQRNEPFKQQQLNGRLYRLFTYMLLQAQMTSPSSTKRSLSLKVIDLLQKQLFTGFDSQAIGSSLDMNYSYISRRFKEETGETVKGFYLTLKTNEAIRLFQTTSLNIAQVSDRLGFQNPYHFSRVFKKIKGVAPGAYRKQLY